MRNNKKRGFTLVELLVVIAILAILATVSVVGYTSFIESATVSNDENLATQLNKFLLAYQANSNSEYYGQEITEDNVWFITQEILEESGIDELEPQALKYDYHFYYDFTDKQYVVKKDSDVGVSFAQRVLGLFANAAVTGDKPGNVFTTEGRYFLVDTKGSDLADVVRAFYTFEGTDDELKELLNGASGSSALLALKEYAKTTIIVTENGLVHLGTTGNKTVFVHAEAPSIEITDETLFADSVNVFVPTGTTITTLAIPGGKVVFDEKNWSALETQVDINFVNDTVELALSKNSASVHKLVGEDKIQLGDVVVATLKYMNPVDSFKINAENDGAQEYQDYLRGEETIDRIFVSLQNFGEGLKLFAEKEIGVQNAADSENKNAVSKDDPNYKWVISKIIDKNGNAISDIASIASIEGNVLKLANPATYDTTIQYIEVTATSLVNKDGYAKDEGVHAERIVEVHLAAITGVDFALNGQSWNWTGDATTVDVTLLYSGTDGEGNAISTYPLKSTIHSNNWNSDIDMDANIVVSSSDETVIKVANGSSTTEGQTITNIATVTPVKEGDTTLTVKLGYYRTLTINVHVEDISSATAIKQLNSGIIYVGNGDAIRLEEIFTNTSNIPEGSYILVTTNAASGETWQQMMSPTNRGVLDVDSTGVKIDDADYVVNYDPNDKYIPLIPNSGKLIKLEDADGNPVDIGEYNTIKFAGAHSDMTTKVSIAIFNNGVRISDDVTVSVVDGVNYSHWDEFTKGSTGVASVNTSIVLLNDIAITPVTGIVNKSDELNKLSDNYAGRGGLTIAAGKKLYGNLQTIDLKGLSFNGTGFVTLNKGAEIHDVRIVADVFPKVSLKADHDYGTNVVFVPYGGKITNSYLSGARAPLAVGEENSGSIDNIVTLDDVVLFGGTYANLDLRGKVTLKLVNNIVTINQPYGDDPTTTDKDESKVGTGITAWLEADPTTYKIDTSALTSLKQYNFINQSMSSLLGTLTISKDISYTFNFLGEHTIRANIKVDVPLSSVYNKIFTNIDTYRNLGLIYGSDTTPYVNTGIVSVKAGIGDIVSYGGDIKNCFANTNYGYTTFNADVAVESTALESGLSDRIVSYALNLIGKSASADFYIYSPKQTVENNQKLFEESQYAVEIYSPVEMDGCKAYDFQNGKIIYDVFEYETTDTNGNNILDLIGPKK